VLDLNIQFKPNETSEPKVEHQSNHQRKKCWKTLVYEKLKRKAEMKNKYLMEMPL
jgi:hypothetical protein